MSRDGVGYVRTSTRRGASSLMEKPKIRPVEAFPIEQNGQTLICLRDQTGIARDPIVVGMGAYFLITLFDGANTLADLHAAFTRRFGQFVSPEQLRGLIDALDSAHFLDSPAYAARLREVREEFLRSPQRPAALAGLCYEKDPQEAAQGDRVILHGAR